MKLKRLSLAHYRGFEQLDITFEPDVTVIAGVNGVGKSSVLNALAQLYSRILPRLSPSRAKSISVPDDDIYSDAVQASITAEFVIRNREWNATISKRLGETARLGQVYPIETSGVAQTREIRALKRDARQLLRFLRSDEQRGSAPLAVYFSPKRQLPDRPRTLGVLETQGMAVAYRGALQDREVQLREFMHWFRTQETLGAEGELPRASVLDSLRKVVTELVPEFTNLSIEEEPRLGFVVKKVGKPLYLHQLSDGERGLLALVFDLTRRLAIANPESDDPIREGVALVLLDEIELHLHPKWQREVLQRLKSIFAACQFVVTTHSPLVLGEVEARCIRFLEWDNGKVVATTPQEALGLDANRILLELMEAPVRNRAIEEQLNELFDLIDDEQFDMARKVMEGLRAKLGEHDPELTRASSLLKFLEGEE